MHEQLSVNEITNAVFDPSSQMVKCDPRHGIRKHNSLSISQKFAFVLQENTWHVAFSFVVMSFHKMSIAPLQRSKPNDRYNLSTGVQRVSKLESITNPQVSYLAATWHRCHVRSVCFRIQQLSPVSIDFD